MRRTIISSALTAAFVVAGIAAWTYWDRSAQANDVARRDFAANCQSLGLMDAEERAEMLEKLSADEKRKLLVTVGECLDIAQ